MLAKLLHPKNTTVGQVDCVIEQRLCAEQGIQSYPNIRVYPSHTKGFRSFDTYNHMMRDAQNMFIWANNYLPSYTHMLTMQNFHEKVLKYFKNRATPWLVDFYTPWCGHCQVFAPTFESIASKLEGRVKCGKVNCQEQQQLCQMIGIQAFPTIMFYTANGLHDLNWNSGESIMQYDLNGVLNAVEEKLKREGGTKRVSDKQEL
jgi:DnaJ family protein C protein 10